MDNFINPNLLIIFIVSLLTCWIVTFLMRKIAFRFDIMDFPDERKIHTYPVPYLGGIAIFSGLWIAILYLRFFYPPSFFFKRELEAIFIGSGAACLFGIWDDIRGSGAPQKIIFQTAIGILMYLYGFRIEMVTFPFGGVEKVLSLKTAGLLVTIFWYIFIMNAINLIDGLDGLASGVSAIVSLTIFLISFDNSSFLPLSLSLIILGVSVAFLYHNFFPAKIFMGDAGSLLLGFLLATLTLMSSTKTPALLALIIPIIAMGIPVVDAGYSFLRRTINKKHPFKADKRHLHHRLMALGLSHKRVVILIYYISGFLGLLAYILSKSSPQVLLLAALLIGIGFFILIENISFLEKGKNNTPPLSAQR